MQMNDAELVSKLYTATENARINWEKTAVPDQYAAAFGGKWTVTVDKDRTETGQVFYSLILNDAEGQEILRITSIQDAAIPELFELARRHALRVNEAIQDLLKEIDRPPK
jgi:hypothetical protein